MNLPTTPQGWANHITLILNKVKGEHERFPVDVRSVAYELSRQLFPEAPITQIEGNDFGSGIEGMLVPIPNKTGEWGIIYNESTRSKGRINFTLAHEFGHYLLHRKLRPSGFQCAPRDMVRWDQGEGKIETEANCFASYLLMPLDDFRKQINKKEVSMSLMRDLANRYDVSLTATILKWLSVTDKRAMVVVGREGFIDWAWSSKPLYKSGVFYRARQEVSALPAQSLAALSDINIDNITGIKHPKGVWSDREEVQEMTLLAHHDEMTISLLIYPDPSPERYNKGWIEHLDGPKLFDSFDRFTDFENRINR